MPWWDFSGKTARITGEWDTDGDSERRELTSNANDGIISSAAILQGLLSAGASGTEALVGVIVLTVVGSLSAAGAQYGEAAGERNIQVAILESEKQRLQHSPQEEFEELVEIYQEKGLSPELSRAVATELHARDALAAQLDAESDMEHPAEKIWPFRFAMKAGLAFLAGSIGPLLLFLIMPFAIRGEVTLVVVAISLTISGWIGARSEHGNPWISIARTVAIGLVTLGISSLAGSLVTF